LAHGKAERISCFPVFLTPAKFRSAMVLPSDLKQNHLLLGTEFGLTVGAALLALLWPRLGSGFFAYFERLFAGLARRKWLALATAGLSVIVLRLAILPLLPVPLPIVPDDYGFLLSGDTLAHGRLANPTPAMWTHFESIQITMKPTYSSMYFPGQGLVMAASIWAFGHPWFGLLIVSALMCAAVTWMLQAWLPANWAFLGGMIAVMRLGVFSYFTDTYHAAGSLGALGGALILGGMPRLMKTAQARDGLALGIGVAILVVTRPYEGILMCLPVGFVLARWLWKGKNRPSAGKAMRLAAAPLVLILAAIAWLGYYDQKAFGKATTLPYTVNRQQYAMAPYYIWQHPRPEPHYRYAEMRQFYYQGEMAFYNMIHTWKGFIPYTVGKAGFSVLFYVGFALAPPLVMIGSVFKDRRIRFLVVCVLVMCGGMVIEIFLLPHYVATFTAAFYAIGLQCMRHLRVAKLGRNPAGMAMARYVVAICVVMTGIRAFAGPLKMAPAEWPPSNWNFVWYGPQHFGTERAQILAKLEQLPGGQLTIVRYGPDHHPLDEWVYNDADIDHAKVIWAHDAGPAENQELIQYYRDRTVWLVEPDAVPARISPYPIPAIANGK